MKNNPQELLDQILDRLAQKEHTPHECGCGATALFFWHVNTQNGIAIACPDCTGHFEFNYDVEM